MITSCTDGIQSISAKVTALQDSPQGGVCCEDSVYFHNALTFFHTYLSQLELGQSEVREVFNEGRVIATEHSAVIVLFGEYHRKEVVSDPMVQISILQWNCLLEWMKQNFDTLLQKTELKLYEW